jgi:predicted glutamine amidotransferase
MCLLVNQSADTNFSKDFLTGVYDRNSDGIGIMYAEDGVLHHVKFVPQTAADFIRVYDKFARGKDCTWHARMRTHGDIDLDNCHPYEVLGEDTGYPLYLMHNGVLSTGNSKDTTKSDTWHYIKDFLRPILTTNPEFFLTPEFADLIETHIGDGNKFVLMDAYGNRVTLNEHKFVTYEGADLSNTYAWDTTGTVHDFNRFKSVNTFATPWKYYGVEGSGWSYGRLNTIKDDSPVFEDTEADAWADSMFDVLDEIGYDRAGKALTYSAMVSFFAERGSSFAWDDLDSINMMCMGEDEVISYIRDYREEKQNAA